MEKAARFEKVSLRQFAADWGKAEGVERQDAEEVYRSIQLPRRATAGSAGYDFMAPCRIVLKPGQTALIPTGIRVKMKPDCVMMLFPRSSLGFRYRMQLNNTVGIIDSDYSGAENEGHIFARITNDSNEGKTMEIKPGQGFMQGVFLHYCITEDDSADALRTGGLGSTTE